MKNIIAFISFFIRLKYLCLYSFECLFIRFIMEFRSLFIWMIMIFGRFIIQVLLQCHLPYWRDMPWLFWLSTSLSNTIKSSTLQILPQQLKILLTLPLATLHSTKYTHSYKQYKCICLKAQILIFVILYS